MSRNHPLSINKTFNDFRRDVKQKIEQIYKEEQSMIAINSDHGELQDLVESYDENFSKPYLEILTQEIDNFLNQSNE